MPGQTRIIRRLPVAALAAISLAAAGVGGFVTHNTITVVLDGQSRQITTPARTVSEALDAAGVRIGPHDALAPSASTLVRNGSVLNVVRGRQLHLVVDQVHRTAWVAATSVGDALGKLGLDHPQAYVSTSRATQLPLSGMAVDVRLPHHVTVAVDGTRQVVTTTAPTLATALDDAKVKLVDADRVDTPLDTYPVDGATVTVTRVRRTTEVSRTPIAPDTVQRDVDTLPAGTTRVADEGAPGEQEATITTTTVDGQVVDRAVGAASVVRAAQPRVVERGTRVDQPRASRSAPRTPPAPTADIPSDGSGLNWAALAKCESGGNPRAYNPAGFYGLYQFNVSTWRGVGGTGLPSEASAAEQTARAQMLYAKRGRSPWPVCGRLL